MRGQLKEQNESQIDGGTAGACEHTGIFSEITLCNFILFLEMILVVLLVIVLSR